MKDKKTLGLLLTVSLFSLPGFALAQSATNQSVGMNTYEKEQTLKDEIIGFSPQVGVLNYTGMNGSKQSRALTGFGVDFNISPLLSESAKDYFLGVSVGAFYSHMGASNSNLLGANPDTMPDTGGANLLLLPADVKLGVNITPSFRTSIRAGGNVIYRSLANSAYLDSGTASNSSLWRLYPNAGVDLEWQVSKYISLIARPDLTFTTGDKMFTATLGATIIPSI